ASRAAVTAKTQTRTTSRSVRSAAGRCDPRVSEIAGQKLLCAWCVTFITLCRGYSAKESVPPRNVRGDPNEATRNRIRIARSHGRGAHARGREGIRLGSEPLAELVHELPAADAGGVPVLVVVFAVAEPVLVVVALPEFEQLADEPGPRPATCT